MVALVQGWAQNEDDEEMLLGMALMTLMNLIVMMSFSIWTIIVAQRARREISN